VSDECEGVADDGRGLLANGGGWNEVE